jgi:hypothetical protein
MDVTTLLILYLFFGGLLVILAVPLLREKIKPNGWYGFRVRTTLENPKIWYAVNHHAAKRILAAGVAVILAAVILYMVPNITIDQYAMGVLIVLVVIFGIGMIQSVRYLKKLGDTPASDLDGK